MVQSRSTVAPDHDSGQPETIDGVVDKITYLNEENGYSVARLKVPRQKQLVTVAGHLPGIVVGEGLRVEGSWSNHAQYGRQFTVARYQTASPGTPAALKRYLSSGLLKGVGPVVAEHIVNTFGLDTISILDDFPERLSEVPGMGRKKAAQIAATWAERRALKDLMGFLQAQGLPVTLAVRVLRKYGSMAEAVVREQPYRLAVEIYGVSFAVADGIAQRSGVARDAPQRLGAGLTHVLTQAASSGHVYLPIQQLNRQGAEVLGIHQDKVASSLDIMVELGFVEIETSNDSVAETRNAYLPALRGSEVSLASALTKLSTCRDDRLSLFKRADWETAWRFLAARETVQLTPQQQEAIKCALTRHVAVITGGPGTGKTTTLRGIVNLAQAKGSQVVLAAPTGRAARRLSEATGVGASTVHRLLELRPGGGYEIRAPLDADLVIVDEASMMDLPLSEALLNAVPRGAHLLLVGDADQLPPVGSGSVFRDIMESGVVPLVTLETIFRQPEGSAIVSNAHLINAGKSPLTGQDIQDFFFFNQPAPAACANLVVDLATRRIPDKFGLDPLNDIQVLAPMYAGVCGIDALNAHLQAALNPPDPTRDERRFGSRIFRVGDKVMQTVNDYDRQVSNGEVGRIIRMDMEEQTVVVSFESDWTVAYTFQELDELTHAFAVSVHKAQGSEYPVIIMPVIEQHGRLLQRNLLYTAVSRARQLVVLVGSREALRKGVENDRAARRYTSLIERLRAE